jgi:uncharacterized protein YukJ
MGPAFCSTVCYLTDQLVSSLLQFEFGLMKTSQLLLNCWIWNQAKCLFGHYGLQGREWSSQLQQMNQGNALNQHDSEQKLLKKRILLQEQNLESKCHKNKN